MWPQKFIIKMLSKTKDLQYWKLEFQTSYFLIFSINNIKTLLKTLHHHLFLCNVFSVFLLNKFHYSLILVIFQHLDNSTGVFVVIINLQQSFQTTIVVKNFVKCEQRKYSRFTKFSTKTQKIAIKYE